MESKTGWKINKNILILCLTIVTLPLLSKIFSLSWTLVALVLAMLWLSIKKPKSLWIVIPILFLLDLWVNNLFSVNLKPLVFSFDWEKIVMTNPGYLKLIERYWQEDLWLPFRLRNIFYSPWLLLFSWLNLLFKLWSPTFLIQVLGYSGCFLFILGLVEYFKSKERKIWPFLWYLTVTVASALGMLIDSKSALILALPAIIYFMYRGVKNKSFDEWWIIWLILIVVDLLIK